MRTRHTRRTNPEARGEDETGKGETANNTSNSKAKHSENAGNERESEDEDKAWQDWVCKTREDRVGLSGRGRTMA